METSRLPEHHHTALGACSGWRDEVARSATASEIHRFQRPERNAVRLKVAAIAGGFLLLFGGPALLFADGDTQDDHFQAGISWTCEQYREAVRTGAGHVSLIPPENVAGEDFDHLDTGVRDALERECGDAIRAFEDDPAPAPAATDESVQQALRAAGADDTEIRALGAIAYETGYAGTVAYPSNEAVESFAFIALLECREVRSGEKTWAASESEAIRTGARPDDAARMTAYLRDKFCPSVT